MASKTGSSSGSKQSSSRRSVPAGTDELVTFSCSFAWTCHHCTNINIVDPRNNEKGYDSNLCEYDSCKHKRCIKCGTNCGSNVDTASTMDRLPMRVGIKRYDCAFHVILDCNKRHTSWLAAERCGRIHYTGTPFVPCTVPSCARNFASLDHFREHLQSHHDLLKPALIPQLVEYPVLLCPFRTVLRCHQLSYTLEELQQHFKVHLAAESNRPKHNYVKDCTMGVGGRFACRYSAVFNCVQVFSTPLPEKVHFIKHFDRLLPCPLCEKEFRLPEWMADHLTRHADALNPALSESA